MKAKHRLNPFLLVIAGAVILLIVMLGIKIATPQPKSFGFIKADHPIDMWSEGTDKWAYFFDGRVATKELADIVRADLIGQGFSEDTSKAPWFRFVKGKVEVVVCNHDEFAVNSGFGSGTLVPGKLPPGGQKPGPCACILVKNGPGTETPISLFAIKKLVLRW